MVVAEEAGFRALVRHPGFVSLWLADGLSNLGIFTFSLPEGPMKEVANYVSFWEQGSTFTRGIVDSRYLAFDGSLVAFFLFASHRILVARRLA